MVALDFAFAREVDLEVEKKGQVHLVKPVAKTHRALQFEIVTNPIFGVTE